MTFAEFIPPDVAFTQSRSGDTILASEIDCQTCGACCSYSPEWPRFTTEAEDTIDMVPVYYVAADQRGMRCDGSRCSALCGDVGGNTACLIYDVRPDVCRACSPGDDACRVARAKFGL